MTTKNNNHSSAIFDLTFLKDFDENSEIILSNDISHDVLFIFKMLGFKNIKVTFVLSDVCSYCCGKLHSKGFSLASPMICLVFV